MRVYNNSPGARGVNTEDQGTVMLMPGEERDLKISDAERKSVEAMGLQIDRKQGEPETGTAPGVDDPSVTATSTAPATLHPMPPGQDITRPEEVLASGALVAPWAQGGGVGSAATNPDQLPGGTTSAGETAKAQEIETMTARQPAAPKGGTASKTEAKSKESDNG